MRHNCAFSFVFLCKSSIEPGFVSTAAAGAAGVSDIDDGGASAACTFPILSVIKLVVEYISQNNALSTFKPTKKNIKLREQPYWKQIVSVDQQMANSNRDQVIMMHDIGLTSAAAIIISYTFLRLFFTIYIASI